MQLSSVSRIIYFLKTLPSNDLGKICLYIYLENTSELFRCNLVACPGGVGDSDSDNKPNLSSQLNLSTGSNLESW